MEREDRGTMIDLLPYLLTLGPYLGVFLVLVTASFGLPIPEDLPLLTGGYLCHTGRAHLPIMIAVGMIGVLTGDIILFTMGRRFGHHIVEHRLMRRLVNPSRLLTAERMFARHGVKILFIGRFLPGLRPMIFMAAGVLKVRPLVFIAVNGSAASISVPTLVILGAVFGGSLDTITHDVRVATHTIAAIIIVLALIAGGIWLHRRQTRLIGPEPLPEVGLEDLAKLPPQTAVAPVPASPDNSPRGRASSPVEAKTKAG
jgi:membrane protein DedA with SNARE-associated domain